MSLEPKVYLFIALALEQFNISISAILFSFLDVRVEFGSRDR